MQMEAVAEAGWGGPGGLWGSQGCPWGCPGGPSEIPEAAPGIRVIQGRFLKVLQESRHGVLWGPWSPLWVLGHSF